MGEAKLVYGIGAAKAGTTWLHRYLSSHPECHFRSVKELHYFDTLGADGAEWRARKPVQKLQALDRRRGRTANRRATDLRDWAEMLAQTDPTHQAYLAYLNQDNTARNLVGDMTPSYATLDTARFAEMAVLVPETRFVFLMRDPLDRLWSNIRMSARRGTKTEAEFQSRANALIDQFNTGLHPTAERRSDYATTLENLFSAVPRDRVLIGFFETLFTDAAIARLTRFLGLSPLPAAFEVKALEGQKFRLDAKRRARALDRLQGQYDAVSKFLAGPLPDRWQAQLSRG
ncbi:MAG: sulfotransferase [Rhodobacterales bacterium]|jgi:hypothetical protein